MYTCEICGTKTNTLFKVSIEGTEMKTCSDCCGYGKVISRITVAPPEEKRPIAPAKADAEESVTSNYASLIRAAREKRSLTQEDFAKSLNERLSVIRSI